ncbi:PBECR3 domain-containing polyvalent protein, partial [Helicobacter bizzozeronii]|uniref:PBECR3 domain-containing polyvalent protein n=1 Tax=Helicobacter bizzozeronii TaxID=56877 RepID=UPI000CEE96EF
MLNLKLKNNATKALIREIEGGLPPDEPPPGGGGGGGIANPKDTPISGGGNKPPNDEHTSKEGNGELISKTTPTRKATKEDLTQEFLEEVKRRKNDKVWVGDLTNPQIIQRLGFDPNKPIKMLFDGDALTHIEKRHGEGSPLVESSGQPAVKLEDIQNYPDIVNHADKIEIQKYKDITTLLAGKQINGYAVVIEIVSKKNNALNLKTMYKENGLLEKNRDFSGAGIRLSKDSGNAPEINPSTPLDATGSKSNPTTPELKNQELAGRTKDDKAQEALKKIDPSTLNPEQQEILKVFKGEIPSSRLQGKDLQELYTLETGSRKIGARKILIKHFGEEKTGGLNSAELLNIGFVLRNGEMDATSFELRENALRYAYTLKEKDGVTLRVVVDEFNDGKKIFDFYSSRNFTDYQGGYNPKLPTAHNQATTQELKNQATELHAKAKEKEAGFKGLLEGLKGASSELEASNLLKSVESIESKIRRKQGDITAIGDFLRAAIRVEHRGQLNSQLIHIEDSLRAQGIEPTIELHHRQSGYKGVHIQFNYNGVASEMQLHTNSTWGTKKELDPIYHIVRNPKERAKLTDEELMALEAESNRLAQGMDLDISDFTSYEVSLTSASNSEKSVLVRKSPTEGKPTQEPLEKSNSNRAFSEGDTAYKRPESELSRNSSFSGDSGKSIQTPLKEDTTTPQTSPLSIHQQALQARQAREQAKLEAKRLEEQKQAQREAQEQERRAQAAKDYQQAQEQKQAQAGGKQNDKNLQIGQAIPMTKLKGYSSSVSLDDARIYPLDFVIVKTSDVKPNLNAGVGTQTRTQT